MVHTIKPTKDGQHVVLQHGKILRAGPFELLMDARLRCEELNAIERAEQRRLKVYWHHPDEA